MKIFFIVFSLLSYSWPIFTMPPKAMGEKELTEKENAQEFEDLEDTLDAFMEEVKEEKDKGHIEVYLPSREEIEGNSLLRKDQKEALLKKRDEFIAEAIRLIK